MQPWYGPARPESGEPVIDLGPVDDPASWESPADAQPTPPTAGTPTATRWLLVSVTVVVSVLATVAGMVLFQRATADSEATPPPTPSNMDELRAWVGAGGPADAVAGPHVLEPDGNGYLTDGVTVAPGHYRVHLRCGRLGTHEAPTQISLEVRSTDGNFGVELPCPSATMRMEHRFDFAGLGAMWFEGYMNTEMEGPPYILALWLVPEAVS
ncbi:hypothetical protein AB0I28_31750 [Phytomonospora sp. NPDC050363]|uniref:hypothetical protein n=1 Tax=Phytomonospora sp. NPDC050363 TaxID=3155642 RepID=UPI0033D364E8